ncbi:MAG TPA: M1 family aminopeptidase [Candidatus Sulfotelmatobacter sp.]|nr:M1 family aminopeptidase [Candidatus Sulfotelmatobacter sp.]
MRCNKAMHSIGLITGIPTSRKFGEKWGTTVFIFLAIVVSCSIAVEAQEKTVPVSYDLKVTIEPAQGSIAVHGDIGVPVEANAKILQFGLHETFAITKLLLNGRSAKSSFRPGDGSPFSPATRKVAVNLPSHVSAGKLHLEIEYAGRLKEIPEFGTFPDQKQAMDDQINLRLVELANYSSWYPQFFAYGRPIETALEVSLPKTWVAICSGKKLDEREDGGRTVTRWLSAVDTDILIAAAPNFKGEVIPLPDGQIAVYYTQIPEEFIDRDGGEIEGVMNVLTQGLGSTAIPSGVVKHVFSPMRKGQGRAGIARPGMIVTSEGRVQEELAKDPKFSLLQDLAHEIGHFWWNFGAGQGDWINEAFAEYSSAFAVRQMVSEEQFQKVLERYRGEVRELPADAPSLAKVPFDGSGFVIRYYKGSLMLEAIRQAMGDRAFGAAVREFFQTYKGQSIGTAEFRSFWKEKLGDKRDLIDLWLDSGGGLPRAP